jgi:hypothetical protein
VATLGLTLAPFYLYGLVSDILLSAHEFPAIPHFILMMISPGLEPKPRGWRFIKMAERMNKFDL